MWMKSVHTIYGYKMFKIKYKPRFPQTAIVRTSNGDNTLNSYTVVLYC